MCQVPGGPGGPGYPVAWSNMNDGSLYFTVPDEMSSGTYMVLREWLFYGYHHFKARRLTFTLVISVAADDGTVVHALSNDIYIEYC